MGEALERKYLKGDQRCKVELVQDDSTCWQAIRLTTKGAAGGTFRSLGKQRVSFEEEPGVLRSQQPKGVSLFSKTVTSASIFQGSLNEFASDE